MKQYNNIAIEQLNNGLTLVTIPLPGITSVAALALVGVGSRYENDQTQGLSHFFEHLSVMGTEKYKTNFDFTHKIEEVGADFNAFTGEEYTGYYIKTENRHLPMALDMLSQLLIHPLLKQSEIERERLVILEEIKMREDDPQIKVADRMVELLFAGSGLGLPGTGTPEIVTRFKQDDFLQLQKQHYVGSNIVLVLAGNLFPLERGQVNLNKKSSNLQGGVLRKLVSESFQRLPSGTSSQPQIYTDNHTKPQIEIIKKSTDQVHLCMGFLGYSRRDQERYAQGLLSVILGSGFTSRLFQKIRQEKSLAYSIGTDSDLFTDTGLFAVQAGVDRARFKEALITIWEELQNIKTEKLKNQKTKITKNSRLETGNWKLTTTELRKAKDYLRGKLVLRLEDPLNLAMYYGGQQLLDREILAWEQVLQEIEKVTIADVQKAADHIFKPENMSLVVIGNGKLKASTQDIAGWLQD